MWSSWTSSLHGGGSGGLYGLTVANWQVNWHVRGAVNGATLQVFSKSESTKRTNKKCKKIRNEPNARVHYIRIYTI